MAGHVITIRLEELGHEVEGYAREHLTYCRTTVGNAKDMQALRQLVQSGSYDYVVNAIGILNQDAEKRKTDAIYLNSLLPHALAEMTENLPTRVIHISTDRIEKMHCRMGECFMTVRKHSVSYGMIRI